MLKAKILIGLVAITAIGLAAMWLAILWGLWDDVWLAIRVSVTLVSITLVYLILYLVYREVADENRQRRDGFLD